LKSHEKRLKKNHHPERLIPNHLDQYPLVPFAIELKVEDLLPGAEIQLTVGDCHNSLPAHDRSFQVCIGIIFDFRI
jgi:hypothetical protein